jgi:hypothetical protein
MQPLQNPPRYVAAPDNDGSKLSAIDLFFAEIF